MRVIAGTLGGRKLRAPAGDTTRPTPDRVREALFSALGPLHGLHVLDLFAGSGALGIEALSRGAERCVFVERDRRALHTLRVNLAGLDLAAPEATVEAAGWAAALRARTASADRFDLCLVDPPYARLDAVLASLATLLPPVLCPGARVVIESPSHVPEPAADAWPVARRRDRTYGSVRISIIELDTTPPEPSTS